MKYNDELPADIAQALAEGVPGQAMPPDSRNRIRDRLLARVRADACGSASETIRATDDRWITIGPKLRLRVLHHDRTQAQVSFLLQMAPGAVVPAHEHEMDEECIVVDGEVRIGDLTLTAGDFHLARKGHPHGVMTSAKGSTLYLRGEIRPFHQAALALLT